MDISIVWFILFVVVLTLDLKKGRLALNKRNRVRAMRKRRGLK